MIRGYIAECITECIKENITEGPLSFYHLSSTHMSLSLLSYLSLFHPSLLSSSLSQFN